MSIKHIKILSDAEHDLEIGRNFYNNQQQGIGEYFWDSLISDIDSLIIYAGIHVKKYGYFRMLSRRFPYAIYYDVQVETAYVLAVLPVRRNPFWIKGQIQGRN